MKTLVKLLVFSVFIASGQCIAQETEKGDNMKTYVIEREIPNAGEMSQKELTGISKKSCEVVKKLGKEIEWKHSFVTGDKIFCVYNAKNKELVRKHGELGGFPITQISEVANVISPENAKN